MSLSDLPVKFDSKQLTIEYGPAEMTYNGGIDKDL